MVPTDREKLETDFSGVPPCVNAHNNEELNRSLLEAIRGLAVRQNDNDPEHNYLVGLAYLEGIDVEVNPDRAITLITKAAEANHLDAIHKLYCLYLAGQHTQVNYAEALRWAQKRYSLLSEKLKFNHPDVLVALNDLAVIYNLLGDYENSLKLNAMAYTVYYNWL